MVLVGVEGGVAHAAGDDRAVYDMLDMSCYVFE